MLTAQQQRFDMIQIVYNVKCVMRVVLALRNLNPIINFTND